MYNPRAFKRQFTAPHIIMFGSQTKFSRSCSHYMFTKTADCSQLIVEFNLFFHDFYMIKTGYILIS